jgi:hypothetical protein
MTTLVDPFSGTAASKRRSERRAKSGKTDSFQEEVLMFAKDAKARGITIGELRTLYKNVSHHGTCSGTLSVLHKAGKLVRLTEEREEQSIYVVPAYVLARSTSPYVSNEDKLRNRLAEEVSLAVRHADVPLNTPQDVLDIVLGVLKP